jgi:hypothetical protein
MQGWGIYEQDHNFLYGSNDRAGVEAEYERRVAEDPAQALMLKSTQQAGTVSV